MSETGTYLVIEGIDGAGKTTQKSLLGNKLVELGIPVANLIEPGATPIGQRLRELILDPSLEKLPETELDLFTVARRELVHQILGPQVRAGTTVLADRSWLSSVAYQGFGRGLDVQRIIERSKEAMGDYFMPDKAVILDVPLELTEERLSAGRAKSDWFEQQGRSFFEKVRRGYHWLAEAYDIEMIDGSPAVEMVEDKVWESLGSIALHRHFAV